MEKIKKSDVNACIEKLDAETQWYVNHQRDNWNSESYRYTKVVGFDGRDYWWCSPIYGVDDYNASRFQIGDTPEELAANAWCINEYILGKVHKEYSGKEGVV